jgi:type VI secretion system Hcp family effector
MSQHEANEIAREAQRRWRGRGMLKVALPTAAALGAGAAIAVGSIPGPGGTITGCYAGTDGATVDYAPPAGSTIPAEASEAPGALRVIDPSLPNTITIGGSPLAGPSGGTTISNPAAECVTDETQITWNQQGPPGPQGPAGPAGGQGANGTGGAPGAPLLGESAFGISGAPGNTFLKLDTLKGAIKIDSFELGAQPAATTGAATGAGAGKVTLGTFTITKSLDAASPLLFQGEAGGTDYKEAQLTFERKAGSKEQTYLKFDFTNVLISGIVDGQAADKSAPLEEVTFTFQKCTETLVPAVRGASPVSFNIDANAKI